MGLLSKTYQEWFDIGSFYFNEQNYEKALKAFDNAISLDDTDPAVWYNRGLCCSNLEDDESAILAYDSAIKCDSEYADAYYQKGSILIVQEKFRLGIKNLEHAMELELDTDDYVNAAVICGLAYSGLEKYDEAITSFDEALEIDDECYEALYGKAQALYHLGDLLEAKELLEIALEVDPEQSDASDLLETITDELDSESDDEDSDEYLHDKTKKTVRNYPLKKRNVSEKPKNPRLLSEKTKDEKSDEATKSWSKPKKKFQRPDEKKKSDEPVGFACVAGMQELKDDLTRDVIEPLKHPEKYKKFNVTTPNGILLFGPPGCGKTFIVRKLAEEIGYNFKEISPSGVGSKWAHETSGNIAKIFQDAKNNAPTILFFDEIEALVPKRESLGESASHRQEEINEFLSQLNDASKRGILVVGATNKPDLIDSAIMRSGRMDKRIHVRPPDFAARKELFRALLTKAVHSDDINYDKLAEMTNYFCSSDIPKIVENAGRKAAYDGLDEIEQDLLEYTIENAKPSITKSEIECYNAFEHLEQK